MNYWHNLNGRGNGSANVAHPHQVTVLKRANNKVHYRNNNGKRRLPQTSESLNNDGTWGSFLAGASIIIAILGRAADIQKHHDNVNCGFMNTFL